MTTTTARAEQDRVGNFTRAWPPSVIALHRRHVCRIYNGGWCQSFKFYINNSATFRILIFRCEASLLVGVSVRTYVRPSRQVLKSYII